MRNFYTELDLASETVTLAVSSYAPGATIVKAHFYDYLSYYNVQWYGLGALLLLMIILYCCWRSCKKCCAWCCGCWSCCACMQCCKKVAKENKKG